MMKKEVNYCASCQEFCAQSRSTGVDDFLQIQMQLRKTVQITTRKCIRKGFSIYQLKILSGYITADCETFRYNLDKYEDTRVHVFFDAYDNGSYLRTSSAGRSGRFAKPCKMADSELQ